ncbi:MAG: hypothetical protein QXX61_04820, partial [Ignisphaera sp.]
VNIWCVDYFDYRGVLEANIIYVYLAYGSCKLWLLKSLWRFTNLRFLIILKNKMFISKPNLVIPLS